MAVAAVVLECLLALAFLGAGLSKTFASKMQVESFKKLRLPQWFRTVTGLMQLIGAAALIVGLWQPSWAAWAGIWFAVIMLCAVIAHIRIKDSIGQTAPAFILFLIAVAIVMLQSSELAHFPGS